MSQGAREGRFTRGLRERRRGGRQHAARSERRRKQLDVQDTAETPPKAVPYRICSGKIFGGVMKPAEKAVITFSCVTKANVPEGTAAIEAEMQSVGFADAADEKKIDFYWKNGDLTPDARKKGGVK